VNKLSGKVVVRESGLGIPDLLIVVYDLDPECNIDEIFSSKKSLSGKDFWGRFKGDRIGSVLTSSSGGFELTYEDSEFQVQDPEKRPDLILLVMAPEEPQSKTQCTPAPPQHLMLYCSNIPRVKAGRSETYLIRISTEQLDEHSIHYPKAAQSRVSDKDSLLSELGRSYEIADAVHEKLNERRSQRVAKANEATERVKEAFANFNPSNVPAVIRDDPTYFKPDGNLFENQKLVIQRDLKQLSDLKVRRPLRLRLSQDQLADLGLTIDDNGKVSGTVEFHKLLTRIERTMQGAGLFRVRSPFEAVQKRREAERMIDDIVSTGEDPI
jgi:hypothetical protein